MFDELGLHWLDDIFLLEIPNAMNAPAQAFGCPKPQTLNPRWCFQEVSEARVEEGILINPTLDPKDLQF